MYDLPTSINIQNKEFKIRANGDYRMVLDCFEVLNDSDMTMRERTLTSIMIFFEGINEIKDIEKLGDLDQVIKQMNIFFNCGQENIGKSSSYKLIDWNKDSLLIMSAINNVANKEVRAEKYVHWWTFMGYYLAIGDCALSNIVGIRNKIARGKKLEKYEKEFKLENPQYFTSDYKSIEQKDIENWFMTEVWNKEE